MSFKNRSPITRKLAGVGVIGAALALAPTALAASAPAHRNQRGAGLTANAAQVLSTPFTIGASATTVTPGQTVTISGLAYARAGKELTIVSHAIDSSRTVDGVPAVQTPAQVEGTYRATVRIPTNARPGNYPVALRFGNRVVASLSDLQVVASGAHTGGSTNATGCAGIGFTVLHNDRAGVASLPAGGYTVSSRAMSCGTASADFADFLAAAGRQLNGWTSSSPATGRATFTQLGSGLSFSVAENR